MEILLGLIETNVLPHLKEKIKSLNEKEKKFLLDAADSQNRERLKELIKD